MGQAPTGHAVLSPSSAHRWLVCPGSVALEAGIPNRSSKYADEGTKAHDLAARVLNTGLMPACEDREMGKYVKQYNDSVRRYRQDNDGCLLVEQQLNLEPITGEKEAFGTADAVIISDDGKELQIHDLKYGMGVEVSAENNEQLMIYALAALEQYAMMGNFERVKLVIHQVRLRSEPDEWEVKVSDLGEFFVDVRVAAVKALKLGNENLLMPTEKACRFCRAKSTCPALGQKIESAVGFSDLDTEVEPAKAIVTQERMASIADAEKLSRLLPLVPLIEQWCKAVKTRADAILLAGEHLPGYKLVEGKRGNRTWSDEEKAEAELKAMRYKIEDMYNLKLISPTDAEKLMADNPRRWKKVQELITRSDGKPTVVPETDKRPAIVIDDSKMFQSLTTQEGE